MITVSDTNTYPKIKPYHKMTDGYMDKYYKNPIPFTKNQWKELEKIVKSKEWKQEKKLICKLCGKENIYIKDGICYFCHLKKL